MVPVVIEPMKAVAAYAAARTGRPTSEPLPLEAELQHLAALEADCAARSLRLQRRRGGTAGRVPGRATGGGSGPVEGGGARRAPGHGARPDDLEGGLRA
jgi:hypothetical protein